MSAPKVCFYFQVHQPYRLRPYSVFDVGHNAGYFDEEKNRSIMQKVASKCYLPTNRMLLELLNQYPDFKISFSISGVALEQMESYSTETLDSFRALFATGRAELLSETYYHSLAFLYSKDEFKSQIHAHREKVKSLFGLEPTTFRNTELIFNNELAHTVQSLGYKAVLAEGADRVLDWRSPNHVYRANGADQIALLLKNYKLSDDIAFRFSNKLWNEYPLTVEKYADWLVNAGGETINLFMDYETFGEHQWEDSGIFEFLRALPQALFDRGIGFHTPAELAAHVPPKESLDIHHLVSWADMERDLTAWLGNKMQQSSLKELYQLEREIKHLPISRRDAVMHDWRRLQTSDHFYYMCTKWFNDGDVHKYFSPYESPYEAFIHFMNVLNDLIIRIQREAA